MTDKYGNNFGQYSNYIEGIKVDKDSIMEYLVSLFQWIKGNADIDYVI
jgi:hypothetical protein